ncbi:VOC family protein [Streptomyces sp. NPDC001812]|uniref:VOC family protein n=1 Tax=Streptomyces cathayae TaxID=3031124 RepID=A0ABY8K073_9ACTN|nr:VOC family protein [Streptomyces sp. HUAS 5]WGD39667.1 VOC family protein [Streptomyces sp. HUAS 5]
MLHSLAYLGISSPAVDEWPTFATEVLGCMLAEPGPDGAVRLRVDDALWRIQIHPGEVDAVDYFGWAVTDEASLDELQGRLEAEGVEVHEGDAELAAARAVNRIRWFVDPWGYRHELIWGQIIRPSSFRPGRAISRFITGQQGLGHVVVGMPDLERAHDFFTRVLGFELSDKIITDKLEAHFYHVNGRHHSLALGRLPEGVVGFNHLMLQLEAIDDVGRGYDLCLERGVPISKVLGRHANDRMVSFYLTTPSAFNIEYGYGGVEIDEDWTPKTFDKSSIWGHTVHEDNPKPSPGIVRRLG